MQTHLTGSNFFFLPTHPNLIAGIIDLLFLLSGVHTQQGLFNYIGAFRLLFQSGPPQDRLSATDRWCTSPLCSYYSNIPVIIAQIYVVCHFCVWCIISAHYIGNCDINETNPDNGISLTICALNSSSVWQQVWHKDMRTCWPRRDQEGPVSIFNSLFTRKKPAQVFLCKLHSWG